MAAEAIVGIASLNAKSISFIQVKETSSLYILLMYFRVRYLQKCVSLVWLLRCRHIFSNILGPAIVLLTLRGALIFFN